MDAKEKGDTKVVTTQTKKPLNLIFCVPAKWNWRIWTNLALCAGCMLFVISVLSFAFSALLSSADDNQQMFKNEATTQFQLGKRIENEETLDKLITPSPFKGRNVKVSFYDIMRRSTAYGNCRPIEFAEMFPNNPSSFSRKRRFASDQNSDLKPWKYLRSKRRAEQEITQLTIELKKCERKTPNTEQCEKIHKKITNIANEVNEKLKEMQKILNQMEPNEFSKLKVKSQKKKKHEDESSEEKAEKGTKTDGKSEKSETTEWPSERTTEATRDSSAISHAATDFTTETSVKSLSNSNISHEPTTETSVNTKVAPSINNQSSSAATIVPMSSGHESASTSIVDHNSDDSIAGPTTETTVSAASAPIEMSALPAFPTPAVSSATVKPDTDAHSDNLFHDQMEPTTETSVADEDLNTIPHFAVDQVHTTPSAPSPLTQNSIVIPSSHPRIHEELSDHFPDYDFDPSHKLHQVQAGFADRFGSARIKDTSRIPSEKKPSGDEVNAAASIGASGPFMQLCEQLSPQQQPPQNQQFGQPHQVPPQAQPQLQNQPSVPIASRFQLLAPTSFSSNGNFQAQQFTGRGGSVHIPITGETMKASSQVVYNPGYTLLPYQMCFYTAPNAHYRNSPQPGFSGGATAPGSAGFMANSQGETYSIINSSKLLPEASGDPGLIDLDPRFRLPGMVYVPGTGAGTGQIPNFHSPPNAGFMSPGQGPATNNMNVPQNFFCTYTPNVNAGNPVIFRDNHSNNEGPAREVANASNSEVIYASYLNHYFASNNSSRNDFLNDNCGPDSQACSSTAQCIPKSAWCNSRVDCYDSSDETACSCKSRLTPTKICDGYADCPMEEDEVGCFGCAPDHHSCFHNQNEYETARSSDLKMCYTSKERCDGYDQCINGKDEVDCTMLVQTIGHQLSYVNSYTEGYLHRNFKGKWYPVCDDEPLEWATSACQSEMDTFSGLPIFSYNPGTIQGPFIQRDLKHRAAVYFNQLEPILTDTCIKGNAATNLLLYVKCPAMKCGLIKKVDDQDTLIRVIEGSKASNDPETRIVGGNMASPASKPYIVAIYRNGHYHCGGAIHSENWIITAAHCLTKFKENYYEIHAGMLRRYSYSSSVQTVTVAHAIVHEGYNKSHMSNDIALLKLKSPLIFNRWVRPICLPGPNRSALGNSTDWIWGPEPNTLCTILGWGATSEKGVDPDHLREVEIPMISRCKYGIDQAGEEVCAGELAGGKDACQGDSGGPLVCRSVTNSEEWYLAGIVSHGEGCARPNEFGAYTRVSLYLDWISMEQNRSTLPAEQPLQLCPGFICVWGGRCIPSHSRCDAFVDCLAGEDEIGCAYEDMLSAVKKNVENNYTRTELPPPNKRNLTDSEFGTATPITKISPDNPKKNSTVRSVAATQDDVQEEAINTSILLEKLITTAMQSPEFDAAHQSVKKDKIEEISGENSAEKEGSAGTSSEATSNSHDSGHRSATSQTTGTVTTTIAEESSHTMGTTETTEGSKDQSITDNSTPQGHGSKAKSTATSDKFTCTDIHQIINAEHRCDRSVDCEDGTDERGCSCRDYLIPNYKHLICDGKVDCRDLTDEEGCLNCAKDEFSCRLSGECVKIFKRCDSEADCPYNEDESNCVTLSNGLSITSDVNNKPYFLDKGYATFNANGTWSIVCMGSDEEKYPLIAKNICMLIGFRDFKNFTIKDISAADARKRDAADPIDGFESDFIESRQENENDIVEMLPPTESCQALYIECLPYPFANNSGNLFDFGVMPTGEEDAPEIKPMKAITRPDKVPTVIGHKEGKSENVNVGSEHDWPWIAEVYVNGNLSCTGIIVDRSWIMVHYHCLGYVSAGDKFIVVLLGGSRSFIQIQGPYEQIIKVDDLAFVDLSNVVLLHLQQTIRYNRYILPTFVPQIIDAEDDRQCVAISQDTFDRTKTLPVSKLAICRAGYNCYRGRSEEGSLLHCSNSQRNPPQLVGKSNKMHIGVVLCEATTVGWYPSGFYATVDNFCAFRNNVSVMSLKRFYNAIQSVIVSNRTYAYDDKKIECDGHRCPLGKCLSRDELCDGKADCRDSSDENEKLCEEKKKQKACYVDQFKCRNGNCVDKKRFCDNINNCGDHTDEPIECSCFTYLSVTSPHKICNGVKDCLDKSDESPSRCGCRENSFRCGFSGVCVSHDFVCDGVSDCPNNEDELYCYGIEKPLDDNEFEDDQASQYVKIIQQSHGLWYTKCFPKEKPPTDAELLEICKQIGYSNSTKIATVEEELLPEGRSHFDDNMPTKIVMQNYFSTLKVNDNIRISLKGKGPIFKVAEWDQNDMDNCLNIKIQCA